MRNRVEAVHAGGNSDRRGDPGHSGGHRRPRFPNASQDAQVGGVETQLQTIRSRVELFRVENNGNCRDFAATAWADLIGPNYVRAAPVNPRSGTGVGAGVAPPQPRWPARASRRRPSLGWYFDAATGNLQAAGFNEDYRHSDGTDQPWY